MTAGRLLGSADTAWRQRELEGKRVQPDRRPKAHSGHSYIQHTQPHTHGAHIASIHTHTTHKHHTQARVHTHTSVSFANVSTSRLGSFLNAACVSILTRVLMSSGPHTAGKERLRRDTDRREWGDWDVSDADRNAAIAASLSPFWIGRGREGKEGHK